jgi:hypothetical protein
MRPGLTPAEPTVRFRRNTQQFVIDFVAVHRGPMYWVDAAMSVLDAWPPPSLKSGRTCEPTRHPNRRFCCRVNSLPSNVADPDRGAHSQQESRNMRNCEATPSSSWQLMRALQKRRALVAVEDLQPRHTPTPVPHGVGHDTQTLCFDLPTTIGSGKRARKPEWEWRKLSPSRWRSARMNSTVPPTASSSTRSPSLRKSSIWYRPWSASRSGRMSVRRARVRSVAGRCHGLWQAVVRSERVDSRRHLRQARGPSPRRRARGRVSDCDCAPGLSDVRPGSRVPTWGVRRECDS